MNGTRLAVLTMSAIAVGVPGGREHRPAARAAGTIPPQAVLKSTDSTSLDDVSWYTTPAGSRIGLIDTQGDSTGGAMIAWVIIGGSEGFLINPAQFYFSDGSFTDKGSSSPPLTPPGTG